MVPRQPGQPPAVAAQARRRIKIISRHQDVSGAPLIHVDAHDGVDCFPVTGVVLAHAEKKISSAINDAVGVAQISGRRQRARGQSRLTYIQPLIGKIRKDNRPL
jgi:hypothetical protein